MHNLKEEASFNFGLFFDELPEKISNTVLALTPSKETYRESYFRLISLQAWRVELFEKILSKGALSFFVEAQNDALMSHCLARQGAWRMALMALRSCIENTLFGIYYKDHPIELAQWGTGDHKLGFTETAGYLCKHPFLVKISESENGIALIKDEYSTLSKAVHGSAISFRMTKTGEIEGLNYFSLPDLGAWQTRERLVLIGLNSILIAVFKEHLVGAKNLNLRKSVSLAIPNAKHETINKNFGVRLFGA